MRTQTNNQNTMQQAGQLYVVATPIGNLGDISLRAIETLRSVDLIACEDTRHTKNLCRHFDIATPLVSYFREKEQSKAVQLVEQLLSGKNIALVSDAGTPGVSDPGAVLVRKARDAGIEVLAIAGPSAIAAAISIAGMEQTAFFFGGFPPSNKTERKTWLRQLAPLPCPLVFYEAPHRIAASLADMAEQFGNRRALLFREITKMHEECLGDTLLALQQRVESGVKGELVLIVDGAEPTSPKPDNIEALLLWYRDEIKVSLKDAVANIARDLDLPRSQVYKQALKIWQDAD
ncbi:16S rRNA (cytidine(1402)-2'-O)-methyltransferase [uncultured Vibrio sp.]|uniref:16S rRNA (cytidine(1402)-2'-O)-methyltransferase n=1 Tax=uncultured Vibrio sp. TaxID=114054 RepID=UPI002AA91003|nr:16S rRNA (cytidine(1402)-2'-O)-methyltransferase [uncultured Vibrio sp.]